MLPRDVQIVLNIIPLPQQRLTCRPMAGWVPPHKGQARHFGVCMLHSHRSLRRSTVRHHTTQTSVALHAPNHSCTRSLTHSLTRSHTHSLTHSLTHPSHSNPCLRFMVQGGPLNEPLTLTPFVNVAPYMCRVPPSPAPLKPAGKMCSPWCAACACHMPPCTCLLAHASS
jgi:hypothetical protein